MRFRQPISLGGISYPSRRRASWAVCRELGNFLDGARLDGPLLAQVIDAIQQNAVGADVLAGAVEVLNDGWTGTGRQPGDNVVVVRTGRPSVMVRIGDVIAGHRKDVVREKWSEGDDPVGPRENRERLLRCDSCGTRQWEKTFDAHRAECKGMTWDYMARRSDVLV